jgi:ATP-dependent helicase HrpB
MISLPVDAFLPDIEAALEVRRAVVLSAAPGAGKTTRVPPALADNGRVILLQPRRVAARAVTRRIADERGWVVGREIGWQMRFDRRESRATRLLVVTEGILTARLQQDPLLSAFTSVVFDEFHERSIHTDIAMAMARQAWLARDDLRIVVMSATLDTTRVSAFLNGAPVIDVPGQLHPIDIEYAPGEPVSVAARDAMRRHDGQVLCFLPGAREIEQTRTAIHDVDVVPLYGALEGPEQDKAIAPVAHRRVILATNIAETSLTVPGVHIVIDSGLHKVARYHAERGIDSLDTERISLDSADQRAGRAGRLGPGLVRRLWDARDRLKPHREPDIARIDLASGVLDVYAWGGDPNGFEWFEAPAPDRVAHAERLLERLGALAGGRITAVGRLLQRIPLHPRLARILVDGRGAFEAAAACALLSEGSALRSDLLEHLDRWREAPPHLHALAADLQRLAVGVLGGDPRPHIDDRELRHALFMGYADRLAQRRPHDPSRVLMATGHGAVLQNISLSPDSGYLVALDVVAATQDGHAQARMRASAAVESEWIAPTHSELRHELVDGRVRAVRREFYDALVLRDIEVAADPTESAALLAQHEATRPRTPAEAALLARMRFAGLEPALALTLDAGRTLDRLAPESLALPSGRFARLDYHDDGSVSAAVKLQELFGLAESPRLGPQQMPVTFYLLAPNGRPVQTTRDLRSFWERTYPEVRKELRGRYPRHPWPEDPWTATPTHRTKKR